jgi:hypothetical protein
MVSGQTAAILISLLTIGMGTALRTCERRKPMRTKTNVKAGLTEFQITKVIDKASSPSL